MRLFVLVLLSDSRSFHTIKISFLRLRYVICDLYYLLLYLRTIFTALTALCAFFHTTPKKFFLLITSSVVFEAPLLSLVRSPNLSTAGAVSCPGIRSKFMQLS